jgi:hypothetical protein
VPGPPSWPGGPTRPGTEVHRAYIVPGRFGPGQIGLGPGGPFGHLFSHGTLCPTDAWIQERFSAASALTARGRRERSPVVASVAIGGALAERR